MVGWVDGTRGLCIDDLKKPVGEGTLPQPLATSRVPTSIMQSNVLYNM